MNYITALYYWIIQYYRIISRDNIAELYYGIVLWDNITESYYGIILRNYITESYYGMIWWNYLRNHLYEKDTGMPRTSPEPPRIWGSLGPAPGNAPGTPRHAPGTPWGRPWDPRGPSWTYLNKYAVREALNCCVQTCLLGPISWRFPQERFTYKKSAKIKKHYPPDQGFPRGAYG